MKLARSSLFYGALFSLAWWALTEANHQAWWFGLAVIIPLSGFWAWRFPLPYWRWRALPGLVGLFVQQTWLGSWDVAKRALRPNRQVEPCVLDYSLSLQSKPLQQVWIAMIGLFPGTLSVAVQGQKVTVHVLDRHLSVLLGLEQLEQRLKHLSGEEVSDG